MVSADNRKGVFVTIPLYFVMLACCVAWARRREKQSSADHLSSHYLGGRQLGPFLTAGTIFASFYSGYTVVGIPNEAYDVNGFMALRWVAAGFAIITGYYGTGLRLRKAALVRNHKTPVDFITDRFQSQLLRYTVLFLQVVPALIYITAQVVALKSTFNSIFGLDEDSVYPVIIIMFITLMFEWLGGINSVALTDCVQGLLMLGAYIALPVILVVHFGGWKELDPTTYPKPEYYQTPTKEQQLDFWQFAMQTFTFFTLPHLMQRTYAARDLISLKCAYITLTGGMWFMMMVGVFIGTLGVQILDGAETSSPFTDILEQVMDLGGFPYFIGLIAVTASLAAIMSTADSLLIAISQIVTEEIVYPLYPEASPADMVWIGRLVSLSAAMIASLAG
jgi:Na+/proline symporter